ncbi:MAG: hypothetical protein ACT4PL_00005, partial [Phycisphaerales bacterium]
MPPHTSSADGPESALDQGHGTDRQRPDFGDFALWNRKRPVKVDVLGSMQPTPGQPPKRIEPGACADEDDLAG